MILQGQEQMSLLVVVLKVLFLTPLVIKKTLENGNDIKLSGFGNFMLRDKLPRPGRNPKTGEEVTISSRRVVTFKSGLKLKSKLEAYDGSD